MANAFDDMVKEDVPVMVDSATDVATIADGADIAGVTLGGLNDTAVTVGGNVVIDNIMPIHHASSGDKVFKVKAAE